MLNSSDVRMMLKGWLWFISDMVMLVKLVLVMKFSVSLFCMFEILLMFIMLVSVLEMVIVISIWVCGWMLV